MPKRKILVGSGALMVLALVMGACGANGTATKGDTAATAQHPHASSPPTTAAPVAAAPAAPAPPAPAPAAPSAAPTAAPGGGTVPNYQPSTVVSQAGGHTQLTSTDDVAKTTAFYQQALTQDGWSLASSAKTAASANFVAKRSGMGATVAISTMGPTGTSISISTYPG